MGKNITIAIPTFERGETVKELVESLSKHKFFNEIQVLVCDNCSQDGSWEMIQTLKQIEGVTLAQNKKNIGFQGNFLRVIELCQTQYVVLLSDEDTVDLAKLKEVNEQYMQKGNYGFISPIMKIAGNIYRGTEKEQIIGIKDFFNASCYVSGLIFERTKVIAILETIGSTHFLDKDQVYPQCLLLATILAKGERCLYAPVDLVSKRHQLASRINETSSSSYEGLQGRIKQVSLFNDYFTEMLKTSSGKEYTKWTKLRIFWAESSYKFMRMGYLTSYPELRGPFLKGVRRAGFFSRSIRKLIKLILRR